MLTLEELKANLDLEQYQKVGFIKERKTKISKKDILDEGCDVYILPDSIKEIQEDTFLDYTSLKEIIFVDEKGRASSNHVEILGDNAFRNTSLKKWPYAKNLKTLGSNAFSYSELTGFDYPQKYTSATATQRVFSSFFHHFEETKLESFLARDENGKISAGNFPNSLFYHTNKTSCTTIEGKQNANLRELSWNSSWEWRGDIAKQKEFYARLTYFYPNLDIVYVNYGEKTILEEYFPELKIVWCGKKELSLADMHMDLKQYRHVGMIKKFVSRIDDEDIEDKDCDVYLIPDTVRVINKEAFKDCHYLREVIFYNERGEKTENPVRIIKERAFLNTALEVWPQARFLETIGLDAFSNTKLMDFTYNEKLNSVNSCFQNTPLQSLTAVDADGNKTAYASCSQKRIKFLAKNTVESLRELTLESIDDFDFLNMPNIEYLHLSSNFSQFDLKHRYVTLFIHQKSIHHEELKNSENATVVISKTEDEIFLMNVVGLQIRKLILEEGIKKVEFYGETGIDNIEVEELVLPSTLESIDTIPVTVKKIYLPSTISKKVYKKIIKRVERDSTIIVTCFSSNRLIDKLPYKKRGVEVIFQEESYQKPEFEVVSEEDTYQETYDEITEKLTYLLEVSPEKIKQKIRNDYNQLIEQYELLWEKEEIDVISNPKSILITKLVKLSVEIQYKYPELIQIQELKEIVKEMHVPETRKENAYTIQEIVENILFCSTFCCVSYEEIKCQIINLIDEAIKELEKRLEEKEEGTEIILTDDAGDNKSLLKQKLLKLNDRLASIEKQIQFKKSIDENQLSTKCLALINHELITEEQKNIIIRQSMQVKRIEDSFKERIKESFTKYIGGKIEREELERLESLFQESITLYWEECTEIIEILNEKREKLEEIDRIRQICITEEVLEDIKLTTGLLIIIEEFLPKRKKYIGYEQEFLYNHLEQIFLETEEEVKQASGILEVNEVMKKFHARLLDLVEEADNQWRKRTDNLKLKRL